MQLIHAMSTGGSRQFHEPPPERLSLEEASTADLVREALDEAKELVRIEIEMAKAEIDKEITQAKKAAVFCGIAASASVLVVALLAVALVLALGGTALIALLIAAAFLVIGGTCAFIGYSMIPKKPFSRTRRHLEQDVRQLKEHVA